MHRIAHGDRDDDLLDALLEQLESLAMQFPTASFDDLLAHDPQLVARLAHDSELAAELASKFAALCAITRQMFPVHADRSELPNVPGYLVLEIIGHGGAGVVYRAEQISLGREVALKVMLGGRFASERARERFRHEAELAASLQHSGIAQIFDHGEFDNLPYLSQEFIPGGTLAERMHREPYSHRAAAQLVESLARAAHYAHQCRIVHRDIKPGNVLLTNSGEPKIVDFGLAKAIDVDNQLTRTGEAPGTPSYMAPEQVDGRPIGPHTDVYGLGTILFELLAGRPPFEGKCPGDVYEQVRSKPARFEPAVAGKIPPELRAITLKTLEKNPSQRYDSARELADDLRRWLEGLPTKARPLSRTVRAVRWSRRHPAAAALTFVSAVAAMTLLFGSIVYSINLARALHLAKERGRELVRRQLQLELKEQELRRHLYAAEVPMAQLACQRKNLAQARELLARHIPTAGERDLRSFDWYLLDNMCNSERLCLRGHKGDVYTATYSPDGKLLATCGVDRTVRLWDAQTGRERARVELSGGELNFVEFSTDGKLLASADDAGTVRIWKLAELLMHAAAGHDTHAERALYVELKMPSIAWSLDFSPNSSLLAIGCEKEIEIYDIAQQQFIHHWQGFARGIRAICFPRDDEVFFASYQEMFAAKIGSDQPQRFPLVHEHSITSLAHAHRQDLLASIDARGAVRMWNSATREPVPCSISQIERLDGLDFSPDDQYLAIAGKDRVVELWDLASQKLKFELLGHTGAIWATDFSPDGSRIAAAGADGTVRVWETRSAFDWQLSSAAATDYTCAAFSADGTTLAAGTTAGTLEFWDWTARKLLTDPPPRASQDTRADGSVTPSSIVGLCYLADGSLATLTAAGVIDTWNTTTYARIDSQAVLPHAEGLLSTPNGQLLVAWDSKAGVCVWTHDRPAWTRLNGVAGPILNSRGGDVMPNGEEVVLLSSTSSTIDFLSSTDGKLVRDWRLPYQVLGCWAFSRDGTTVATGGSLIDRAVHLWEVPNGLQHETLVGHTSAISALAFHPDGELLASGSTDGTVRLWNLFAQHEALVLPACAKGPAQLRFSPDGRGLAVVGQNAEGRGQIHIWSVKPGCMPRTHPKRVADFFNRHVEARYSAAVR